MPNELKEELWIVPEQMGQFHREYPDGRIWMTRNQLNGFFGEQGKRETNSQTVVRLMTEGRWKECLARWNQSGSVSV